MANKGMTLKMMMALDTKQWNASINALKQQLGGLASQIKTVFSVASVAMFGRSLLETTKTFEDSMARVQAVSDATRGEFKMMEKEALRLGATTRYTATQVANTLEVLTRNGLKANDATNVLAETLHLAQANAVSLADAGNMMTNALNMFGLKTTEVTRVSDVMSSVVSNTATNLEDFYDALVNAAPMANALGISIEETASAIGALAQVGVKGADAGTQLRMALQKLVDPSAIKKLAKLGIVIDEETIRIKGFKGVLEELAKADLPVSTLNEIFTVRSSKAVLQLIRGVDQFNRVLNITQNSAGTTMRMFQEGVGSIRYEVDILKSVWENFLVSLGKKTTGPINSMLRGLQNTITAFQTTAGKITNFGAIIALSFTGKLPKIKEFFSTIGTLRKKDLIEEQIAAAETIKSNASKIASNKRVIQSIRERAAATVSAKDKEIKALRSQISTAETLKATMKSLAVTAAWMAAVVAIQQLVTWLIAANRELRDAKQAFKDASKESQKLGRQVELINKMIGDGKNEASLNGAVKLAIELFPQFADAIRNAQAEAGKTKNYERLKDLLNDISKLQQEVIKRDALQGVVDARTKQLGKNLYQNAGAYNITTVLEMNLEKMNIKTPDEKQSVFDNLAKIMLTYADDPKEQIKLVRALLDGYGVKKTNEEVRSFINKVALGTPVASNTMTGAPTYKDNGYTTGVQAIKDLGKSIEEVEKETGRLTFNDAFKEFNLKSAKAASEFSNDMRGYKERMGELVDEFEEKVKGLTLSDQDKKVLEYQRKLWPSKEKKTPTYTPEGTESKKKTEFDTLTDALNDYNKESKKLDEQLKNNAISQLQYDAAMIKLNHDTWMAVAGISELDKKMTKLSQPQKDAYNKVKDNASDVDTEAAKVGVSDALQKFVDNLSEIQEKRKNGQYENDDEYYKALVKLENETWENISSFKNLKAVVDLLPTSLRDQYTSLESAAQANKDFAKKMQDLDLSKYFASPVFPGINKEERQGKTSEFNDVRDILAEYMKKRAEIQEQGNKGILTTDETQKQLNDLDNKVIITVAAFHYLNEVVSKMPQEFQDALNQLKKSDTNNLIGEDSGYDRSTVQKYTDAFNKAMDPKNYDTKKMLEDLEVEVDLKIGNVEELEKMFQSLSEKILSGEIDADGIAKAMEVLNLLVKALQQARDEAEKTKDKLTYTEQIVELEKEIKTFKESAVDNISNVASAFDRLIDAIESIAEAFGAEWELEGLKKVMTVVNGVIQVMEALKTMIVMVQTVSSIASKAKQRDAHKEALANMEVAASETVKAGATAGSAAANAADSVAGIPIVGPALAVAAVAAVVAAILAGMSKFENGGILQGSSSHGDKNIYRGNRGEMVINKAQQGSLYRAIAEGRLGGGQVEFKISGDNLIGVINNHQRKWK